MCKQIIDMGRLMWVKECGLETQLVKYVPSSISPENHLLIARHTNHYWDVFVFLFFISLYYFQSARICSCMTLLFKFWNEARVLRISKLVNGIHLHNFAFISLVWTCLWTISVSFFFWWNLVIDISIAKTKLTRTWYNLLGQIAYSSAVF